MICLKSWAAVCSLKVPAWRVQKSWCQIIVGQKLVSKVNSFVKHTKHNLQLKCPKITGNIDEYRSPFFRSKNFKTSDFPQGTAIIALKSSPPSQSSEAMKMHLKLPALQKNSGENWNVMVQSDCSKFWRICCCGFQVRPKMALQLPKVKPNQILGNSSCVE